MGFDADFYHLSEIGKQQNKILFHDNLVSPKLNIISYNISKIICFFILTLQQFRFNVFLNKQKRSKDLGREFVLLQ